MATLLQPTEENLRHLRKFLRLGGLVGIPTETVYGLAANAFDPEVCQKIFVAKGRPNTDPLICHVADLGMAETIAELNPLSRQLAETFWPGPLTLILPKKDNIPDIVTAGLNSVAIRSPSHAVFRQLISGIDFPLAAPSANPFAYISPTHPEHVAESLGDRIDFILDGGPCSLGLESTIVDARDEEHPALLRHGALPQESIEKALGMPLVSKAHAVSDGPAVSPGTASKHYSPRANLRLIDSVDAEEVAANEATAFLVWRQPSGITPQNLFWLSSNASLEEAASRLYAALREIDKLGFASIAAERFPAEGLGLALNDRLARAAAK